MSSETPSAAEISGHYSAALDSVNLINDLMGQASRTAEEVDTVNRNVEHLEIMVDQTYWTTEDLAPLNAAIASGANP